MAQQEPGLGAARGAALKGLFILGLGSARCQPRPVWLAGGGKRQGSLASRCGGTTAESLAYNAGLRPGCRPKGSTGTSASGTHARDLSQVGR